MEEIYEEKRSAKEDNRWTPELVSVWRRVAQKLIDASLELEDELEAA